MSNIEPAVIAMITEGQAELRADIKQMAHDHKEGMQKLTEVQSDLGSKFAEYMADRRHDRKEIEDLHDDIHGDGGVIDQISDLKISQEGDKLRWKLVAAGVGAMFTAAGTVVAIFASAIQPLIDVVKQILTAVGG